VFSNATTQSLTVLNFRTSLWVWCDYYNTQGFSGQWGLFPRVVAGKKRWRGEAGRLYPYTIEVKNEWN